MPNKSVPDIFGIPAPDQQTQLLGLVANVAVIQGTMSQHNEDVDRRLRGIEQGIAKNQEMITAVCNVQAQASSNTRRVDAIENWKETVDTTLSNIASHESQLTTVEVRAESIDKNIDNLATHDTRIKSLEGTRTSVVGAILSALGIVAFTAAAYILAKHGIILVH